MTTRIWNMLPDALHGYKQTIDKNIAEHIRFVPEKERPDRPYMLSSKSDFQAKLYARPTLWFDFSELDDKDKVINVVRIEGAILRNGDACSYGSKVHRDIIKRAANDNHTIGHIIYIDSPGGSSRSTYDYEEAIGYAQSKGQPVIALIDGMSASAGYAAASLCDEIYFVGAHDQVGCIGTMAAFYTQKDGDVNTITQERYVELYATGSPLKNKEYRDAAEGDYKELQKDLDRECSRFHEMVKAHRPNVTEEQLKGGMYNAADVIGSLVDGQGNMASCIDRILELTGNTNASTTTSGNEGNRDNDDQNDTHATSGAHTENSKTNDNQNPKTMKEYPKLMSALGLNALVSDKDNGLYFTEAMADTAEDFATRAETTESTLAAKMQEIAQLNAQIEQLKKDHATAIEQLKNDHTAAIAGKDDAHKKEVDDLKAQLNDSNKQLKDKEEEIKQLSEQAADAPLPKNAPKTNSTGQASESFGVKAIIRDGMTMEEKKEAMKQREAELKRQMR